MSLTRTINYHDQPLSITGTEGQSHKLPWQGWLAHWLALLYWGKNSLGRDSTQACYSSVWSRSASHSLSIVGEGCLSHSCREGVEIHLHEKWRQWTRKGTGQRTHFWKIGDTFGWGHGIGTRKQIMNSEFQIKRNSLFSPSHNGGYINPFLGLGNLFIFPLDLFQLFYRVPMLVHYSWGMFAVTIGILMIVIVIKVWRFVSWRQNGILATT